MSNDLHDGQQSAIQLVEQDGQFYEKNSKHNKQGNAIQASYHLLNSTQSVQDTFSQSAIEATNRALTSDSNDASHPKEVVQSTLTEAVKPDMTTYTKSDVIESIFMSIVSALVALNNGSNGQYTGSDIFFKAPYINNQTLNFENFYQELTASSNLIDVESIYDSTISHFMQLYEKTFESGSVLKNVAVLILGVIFNLPQLLESVVDSDVLDPINAFKSIENVLLGPDFSKKIKYATQEIQTLLNPIEKLVKSSINILSQANNYPYDSDLETQYNFINGLSVTTQTKDILSKLVFVYVSIKNIYKEFAKLSLLPDVFKNQKSSFISGLIGVINNVFPIVEQYRDDVLAQPQGYKYSADSMEVTFALTYFTGYITGELIKGQF